MLRFWIVTRIHNRTNATFVDGNKVYTDKAEALKAWDEAEQDEHESVELVECVSSKVIKDK